MQIYIIFLPHQNFFCPSKNFSFLCTALPNVRQLKNQTTPIWQESLAKIEKNGDRRFSLRGFTQPMGVAEYEIKQLIEEVQNSLPNIEDIELGEDRQEYGKK